MMNGYRTFNIERRVLSWMTGEVININKNQELYINVVGACINIKDT